jgi:Flp pilus assembly protein TadG
MPASAVSSPAKKLFRRFRRDNRGSAAVEFSLIAVTFFALLFAIIETALVFFAGQVLETGIQDSARLIYTNQMTDQNTTADDFKNDLCPRVQALMKCEDVQFDVKYYPPGSSITLSEPITNGAFDATGFAFQIPPPASTGTVVVRGYYQWPMIVTGLGFNIANIGRGTTNKRLLGGLAAFHVEPPP